MVCAVYKTGTVLNPFVEPWKSASTAYARLYLPPEEDCFRQAS